MVAAAPSVAACLACHGGASAVEHVRRASLITCGRFERGTERRQAHSVGDRRGTRGGCCRTQPTRRPGSRGTRAGRRVRQRALAERRREMHARAMVMKPHMSTRAARGGGAGRSTHERCPYRPDRTGRQSSGEERVKEVRSVRIWLDSCWAVLWRLCGGSLESCRDSTCRGRRWSDTHDVRCSSSAAPYSLACPRHIMMRWHSCDRSAGISSADRPVCSARSDRWPSARAVHRRLRHPRSDCEADGCASSEECRGPAAGIHVSYSFCS